MADDGCPPVIRYPTRWPGSTSPTAREPGPALDGGWRMADAHPSSVIQCDGQIALPPLHGSRMADGGCRMGRGATWCFIHTPDAGNPLSVPKRVPKRGPCGSLLDMSPYPYTCLGTHCPSLRGVPADYYWIQAPIHTPDWEPIEWGGACGR